MSEILDIKTGKPSSGSSIDPDVQKSIIDSANTRKTFYAGKYENYKCECGCELFTTATVIKKVPGIDLGEITAEDQPFPLMQIPIWVCAKCGEIAPFIKNDEESMKLINKLLKKDTETKET